MQKRRERTRQGYKAGKKNVKTGKPLYKAADHLKEEEPKKKL